MAKTEPVRRVDLYNMGQSARGGSTTVVGGTSVPSTLVIGTDDGEEAVPNSNSELTLAGGTGLETSASGNLVTVDHSTGDSGDLHTNYAEHDAEETISANWLFGTDKKLQFRDSDIFIQSSGDGQLDIDADGEIELTAPTIDVHGDIMVSALSRLYFRDSALFVYSSGDGQLDLDADGEIELASPTIELAASTRVHISGGPLDLNGNLEFQGAKSITSTSGNLTLAPAGDVVLDPDDGQVVTADGVTLQADNYASQTTGWGISYAGGGDFRYLFTDELHAKAFISDLEQALAGGQIISKSVAVVAADFTVPAAGAAGTLVVEDLPGASGQAVFQANDIVRLRQFTRGAGSLTIADCWGAVTAYSDNGDGTQDWTFTRSAAPNAGAASAASTIEAKSLALDYGVSGNGFYEVNAIDGAWAENSPYAQIVTWETHPHSGKTVRVRLGNLKGITSVAEYGLFAGDGVAAGDAYLRFSDQNADIHNIPMAFYDDGNTQRIGIDPGAGASEALLWAGPDSGNPSFQVLGDGTVWMSMAAISEDAGQLLFSASDGLLLLGPYAEMSATSWVSSRGQVATISGAFHQEAGAWAGTRGLVIERGTTNLIVNPQFYTNITDGWTTVATGTAAGSRVRYTKISFIGPASLQLNKTGGAAGDLWGQYASIGNSVAGTSYVASCRAYIATASTTVRIYVLKVAGTGAQQLEYAEATGAPIGQWITLSTPALTANATGDVLRVYVVVYGAPTCIGLFDAVQCEVGAAASSYCDGSLNWCAWSSTAHNSTSTRTVTVVSLPVAASLLSSRSVYSIRTVVQMPYAADAAWPFATLNAVWSGDATDVALYYNDSDDQFKVYIEGAARIVSSAQTFAAGDVVDIVVTLDYANDLYYMYIDGALAGSYTTARTSPALTNFYLGCNSTTYAAGIVFSEFAVIGTVFTADQVAAMYAMSRPLVDAGATKNPHLTILDGEFTIASSYGGTRLEMNSSSLAIGAGISYGGAGVWLGLDGTTPKFSLYADANNYLRWDGANLAWKGAKSSLSTAGEITATGGSIGGWTLSSTTLANSTNIILDASNKAISINDATFGNAGIQLQYNAGSPRAHIGNGSTEYFKYDGTALEVRTGGGYLRFNNVGFQFDVSGGDIGVVWKDSFAGNNDDVGFIRVASASYDMEISTGGDDIANWQNLYIANRSSSGSTRYPVFIDATNQYVSIYDTTPGAATFSVLNPGGSHPTCSFTQTIENKAVLHLVHTHANKYYINFEGGGTDRDGYHAVRCYMEGIGTRWLRLYDTDA